MTTDKKLEAALEYEERGRPGFAAYLPAGVRYDEELSSSEKLMYAEITALAQRDKKCWAGPGYFAELYGVHKDTVTKWTQTLRNRGYIEVQKVPGGRRFIKIVRDEPRNHPTGENAGCQPAKTPGGENAGCNIKSNTRIHSYATKSNTASSITKKEGDLPAAARESSKRVLKRWNEWCDTIQLTNTPSKLRSMTDKRKAKLRVRQDEGFLIDDITSMLSESTNWLNGWPNFSFDWLLDNDTNWVKVVEGKFRNKKKSAINDLSSKDKFTPESPEGKYDNLETTVIEN